MLNHDQLATVRAALLFWEEEMCPHGEEVGRPYLDASICESLSAKEVADLRNRFTSESMRYVACLRTLDRLQTDKLFKTMDEAMELAGREYVATVILPAVIR